MDISKALWDYSENSDCLKIFSLFPIQFFQFYALKSYVSIWCYIIAQVQ